MESKIEKLKPFNIIIEKGSEQIAKELINASDKINEIIDHLNSQDQEEDKYKKGDKVKLTLADEDGWITGEFKVAGVEVEQLGGEQGYRDGLQYAKDIREDTPEELTDKKKGIDNGVDREDTPEEWEKELRKRWYLWTYNKELDQYITCENEVIAFIQSLLSEREQFAKEELQCVYNHIMGADVDMEEYYKVLGKIENFLGYERLILTVETGKEG